ncbi:hypothetical protein BO85DRAFT_469128 [Aspergillus piperis CBS 112811]|uniref:Uncharacterized protein n=1 Tax=Aspergillus piperis CBS 112811 TaxID=1448313 RepID=A0A8G1VKY6_9EURO|nr:hypothetical protein BO85DRAFT_469128 [Aspergillus piperis CBS 112811]RAH57036.1 hypothetical protein BO85DRAFT_469128 [Aspergillus piperis CBS 112811]
MAMYNMLSVDSLLSRDRLKEEGNAFLVPFSTHDISEESAYEFDAPDAEYIHDSVTEKRRHAVYYHRPSVWCPSRPSRTSSFSGSTNSWGTKETCSDQAANDSEMPEDAYSCIADGCDATAALADGVSGTETNQSQSDQETIIIATDMATIGYREEIHSVRLANLRETLSKPGAIAELRLDEKQSIHEGSLVICVDPAYTLSDHDKPRSDEFDLVSGHIFVVCRLYSDLWALCASASPPQPEKVSGETISTEPMRLAFLPLCAVTLAANFSAFNQRCISYAHNKTDEPRYPGNGLPVMPPPRTSSLGDGKQISRGNRRHIAFPEVVYDTFNRVPFERRDPDFVPADSSLENVLSNLTDRGSRRLQRLGNRMSIRKLWSESKRPALGNTENQLSPSSGYLGEPTVLGAMQHHSSLQRRDSLRSQRLRSFIRVAR